MLPAVLISRTALSLYGLNSDFTAYYASSALRLINVAKVQVVLLEHEGTFASISNLDVTGKDFSISRIKYLAPMYTMQINHNDIFSGFEFTQTVIFTVTLYFSASVVSQF